MESKKMSMKLSKILFHSKYSTKSDIDKATTRLYKGSFINQECSGIFQYNYFAVKMLKKIRQIICDEFNKLESCEVELPILQDLDLWHRSNRAKAYGQERFSLLDRRKHDFCLAPTAEESCMKMVEDFGAKDFPIIVFQIGRKFRDEIRPRYGLVRGREFEMFDAYSFCTNKESADEIYIKCFNAYMNIFKRLELKVISCLNQNTNGDIGGNFTHEFLIEFDVGETYMKYDYELFKEKANNITSIQDLMNLPTAYTTENDKEAKKGLEIGENYYLGDSYSKSMNIGYVDKNNQKQLFINGCYGIGVTRVLSALAGYHTFFPLCVSPFEIEIITNNFIDGEKAYNILFNKFEILYDNRANKSLGEKFYDADLIGIPYRLIIGNSIEFQNKLTNKNKIFSSIDELSTLIFI